MKFTPKKREKFLETLAATCNVSKSAQAVGVSTVTVYKTRRKDEAFAMEWEQAIEAGTATLEAEAMRRAFDGVDEPVFYQGEIVGHVRKYSDNLAMFLLKAHAPEKYRERSDVNMTHSGEAKFVMYAVETAKDADEWRKQHAPK